MVEPVTTLKLADTAMKLFPFAIKALKSVTKVTNNLEFEFRSAHIDYCTAVLKNYCKARTFFVRDEPQYLEEFYVPTSLLSERRERISRATLESLQKIGRHVVVAGTGGSGKTVFMRYLMLDAIERGIAYPVLLELRYLNENHETSLEEALVSQMLQNRFPLGEEYARKALKKGQLVLLLDGFDEVNFSRRKKLVSEIKRLAANTECQVVVSSRPDITLEGWDQFTRVKMAPLELEEACELVEKIRFDDDQGIKDRFVVSLRSGLFKTHEYFLSNPLLLSIMLLTYGHSADIPKRFSSFYERAYIALFEKHDAYKGYRRERETDLDISEFSSLFAAFSTITYDKGVFRFAPTEAASYVRTAKKLASARDISEDGFISDSKQAVCLLVDDGLDLAFVHRSFQEYFTAKYIQSADRKVQKTLIERYGSKSLGYFSVDNVLKYLYELAPTLVEEFYLIPALSKVFADPLERKITFAKWKSLITSIFSGVHRHEGDKRVAYFVNQTDRAANMLSLFSFVREICQDGHYNKMIMARDSDDELLELVPPDTTTSLKGFAARSPLWKLLANSDSFYSLLDFNRIRMELVEMKRRVESKQATEEVAFFHEASRR